MGRLSAWMAGRGKTPLDTDYRAATFGNVIGDKPSSITINRGATQLSAQIVRIDLLSGSAQEQSLVAGLGVAHNQRVLISGYKNHPTAANLNIQIEDTFLYESQFYRVIKVEPSMTDRALAIAESDG